MHTRCKDVCPTLRYALPEPSHYRVLGVGTALSWLIRITPSVVLITAWKLRVLRTFLPHIPVIMHGATTVDEKASCSPDAAGDFDGSGISWNRLYWTTPKGRTGGRWRLAGGTKAQHVRLSATSPTECCVRSRCAHAVRRPRAAWKFKCAASARTRAPNPINFASSCTAPKV